MLLFPMKKLLSLILLNSLFLLLFFSFTSAQNESQDVMGENVKRLRSLLLKDYDKNVRPSKNQSVPTTVKLLFFVENVVELEEKKQILTIKGTLVMYWTDDHLVWNPSDHAGIKMIRFANQEIWRPDIYSLTSTKENHLYTDGKSSVVLVYNNGDVKWFPSSVFNVPCSTRFRHYPFDEHNCTLIFGSWTHVGQYIELTAIDYKVDAETPKSPSQWLLKDVHHDNVLIRYRSNLTYHMVNVTVHLQRSARLYKFICVIPILINLVTTLSGFWLQASEPSRYILGCSNVLMMSLLLQHLAIIVPAGNEVPLIAEYATASLCLSAAFLIVSIIVSLIADCSASPPFAIVRLARQSLDSFLFLSTFIPVHDVQQEMSQVVNGHGAAMTSFDDMRKSQDWMLVSLVVDRIAFWLFVVVYVIQVAVLAAV